MILFTGKMPLPLQNFILFVHRLSVRTTAYGLLLVDAYPSFAEGDAPAAAGAVTAADDPAPPAWEPRRHRMGPPGFEPGHNGL